MHISDLMLKSRLSSCSIYLINQFNVFAVASCYFVCFVVKVLALDNKFCSSISFYFFRFLVYSGRCWQTRQGLLA